MTIDKIKDVVLAAKKVGFTGDSLVIACSIAGAESAFDPDAIGDVYLQNEKWNASHGLMQIRTLNKPTDFPFPDNLRYADGRLFDPIQNMRLAYHISKKGTNFSAWSTFTSGAYKQFVDIVTDCIEQVD